MSHERNFFVISILGLAALAFVNYSTAEYYLPEREKLSSIEPRIAKRDRTKARHRQMGRLRSYARYSHRAKRVVRVKVREVARAKPVVATASAFAPRHITVAKSYLGSTAANLGLPRSLWCGDFMRLVAQKTSLPIPKAPRLAQSWKDVGTRSNGQVGDIAVMSRGRISGHVGFVSGQCGNDSILLVSGNHNAKVQEACYPRRLFTFRSVGPQMAKVKPIPAKPTQVASVPLPRPRPAVTDLLALDIQAMPVALQEAEKPKAASVLAPLTTADKYGIFALDEARAYLVQTATPGGTMTRQGPALAIQRLHPQFSIRLSNAIKQARKEGIHVGIFSAYRPPAFGVGGFTDKFRSLHAYGLAVDLSGIGPAGSVKSKQWNRIAARHNVYNPYGPSNRAEYNHYQPLWTKGIAGNTALRKTILASGPIDLPRMWKVADAILDTGSRKIVTVTKRKLKYAKAWTKRKYAYLKKRWSKKRIARA